VTGIAPHISRLFGAVTPEPDEHANPDSIAPQRGGSFTAPARQPNDALDTKRIRSAASAGEQRFASVKYRSTVLAPPD